jgi:ribonuclease HII
MKRAHDEVAARLAASGQPAPKVLVDGLPVATLPDAVNVIKGDAKSLLIAAASILAKTARDAYCETMAAEFPGYGFAKHKGYPTAAHYAALRELGPCREHRRSFTLSRPEK